MKAGWQAGRSRTHSSLIELIDRGRGDRRSGGEIDVKVNVTGDLSYWFRPLAVEHGPAWPEKYDPDGRKNCPSAFGNERQKYVGSVLKNLADRESGATRR